MLWSANPWFFSLQITSCHALLANNFASDSVLPFFHGLSLLPPPTTEGNTRKLFISFLIVLRDRKGSRIQASLWFWDVG